MTTLSQLKRTKSTHDLHGDLAEHVNSKVIEYLTSDCLSSAKKIAAIHAALSKEAHEDFVRRGALLPAASHFMALGDKYRVFQVIEISQDLGIMTEDLMRLQEKDHIEC